MARRIGRVHALLALLCAGLAAVPVQAAGDPARVSGRVRLAIDALALSDVEPVVVYLVPLDAGAAVPADKRRHSIRQRNARFEPGFLAIGAGDSVDMLNDDAIYHSVFSYSRPNDFDLGLYPAGERRTLVFDHAGVVKTYCSIHEQMNGTIFVAPSPWFAVANASGAFALSSVPPGRYTLSAWSARLPLTSLEVELESGRPFEADLAIGAPGSP